jgi:hypothetical protein
MNQRVFFQEHKCREKLQGQFSSALHSLVIQFFEVLISVARGIPLGCENAQRLRLQQFKNQANVTMILEATQESHNLTVVLGILRIQLG